MAVYALGDVEPRIHPDAYVHPDATVIGNVTIGAWSTVWPHTVLRGDYGYITVGERTSVQDGTVVHCTQQHPTIIGSDCVQVNRHCTTHRSPVAITSSASKSAVGVEPKKPSHAARTACLPLVALTERRRGALEHAVVGHRRHHRVDIVTVERLVERVDRCDRRRTFVRHQVTSVSAELRASIDIRFDVDELRDRYQCSHARPRRCRSRSRARASCRTRTRVWPRRARRRDRGASCGAR